MTIFVICVGSSLLSKATDVTEGMGHRIKQEGRLLHLLLNHLENPQEWKASV